MSARNPDVLVVGGGVIGCAVAYQLARRGVAVALLERERIASQASGAAAGMLAPIAEREAGDPVRVFGLASLERMPALAAELLERSGVDPEWMPSGLLRVAQTDADAARLEARAAAEAELDLTWLDAHAARAAAPGLTDRCRGALFSPREGHVRSPLLALAFARAAARLGARVEEGVPMQELVFDAGRARVLGARTPARVEHAGCLVLCTGAWSSPWVPVEPVRGQMVSLEAREPGWGPVVWGGETYLVGKRDGRIAVGASEERAGFDVRVTGEVVRELLARAEALVPALARATFHGAWAGLRPVTPDRLPAIGPVPGIEGLFVAAGHYRTGVLLAPPTADLVADLVEGKGLPDEARPFDPARFGTPHPRG